MKIRTLSFQQQIFEAVEFANWAHRNNKRKLTNTPYIVHPFHVMVLLMEHGVRIRQSEEIDVLTAAVLHDTLEDNPKEVTFALIKQKFNIVVARIVNDVSLDPSNPDKRLSRQKILCCEWESRIVKVADVLSNTIATTNAIKMFGFKKVQKHFSQAITERIEMEREFLESVCHHREHQPLVRIRKSTLLALARLETA